ncbi:dihydrofolate reductase family protein [uncultured Dokdonia sp.]|uniref:dihydrofolate reductase family protein n=1 Tax=uncultured Dokdonia sp. TaxID=575653 RepID=UPI0026127790|nr:dihydrofolate reductase family protein [uncultured Dokdonia sp.]
MDINLVFNLDNLHIPICNIIFFSNSLHIDNTHDLLHIEKLNIKRIQEIKEHTTTDVYLCGGGQFAGWLLDHGQIDILKLKVNPIILGGGIPLFGNSNTNARMNLVKNITYDNGLQITTYELIK